MDDQVWTQFLHEGQDRLAIADIDRDVAVVRNLELQLAERPACVALGSEEDGAMVAVDSGDAESQSRLNQRVTSKPNQTARAGHKNCSSSAHPSALSALIVL